MGSLDTAIGISTQCWSPTGADTLLEIPRDSLPTLASNGTHHNLLLLVFSRMMGCLLVRDLIKILEAQLLPQYPLSQ